MEISRDFYWVLIETSVGFWSRVLLDSGREFYRMLVETSDGF
jgi:hypothetical protein